MFSARAPSDLAQSSLFVFCRFMRLSSLCSHLVSLCLVEFEIIICLCFRLLLLGSVASCVLLGADDIVSPTSFSLVLLDFVRILQCRWDWLCFVVVSLLLMLFSSAAAFRSVFAMLLTHVRFVATCIPPVFRTPFLLDLLCFALFFYTVCHVLASLCFRWGLVVA